MKRFTIFLLAICTYQCSSAQITDAGISAGFGITRFRNSNTSGRRPDLNPEICFAPMFGIHLDHFFTPSIAVELEADYSVVSQKYDGNISGTGSFKAKDVVSYFEIPLLFEYTESNIYAEIGPKLSILAGGVGDFETNPSSPGDYSGMKITNGFNNLVLSGVAGAGARIKAGKNFVLQAGVRFSYSLTDVTKQFSPDEYFMLYDENKLGVTSKYAHLGVGYTSKYLYKSTTLITTDLLVSLCYHLPEGK